MILLQCQQLKKAYGEDPVLNGISFALQEGERLGIVGKNGAGKTTLLQLIEGRLAADAGSVHLAAGQTIGYLKQHNAYAPGATLAEELASVFAPVREMEARMRELEAAMGEAQPAALDAMLREYDRLQEAFSRAEGYRWQSAAVGMRRGLGFTDEEAQRPVASFSGGQQSRVMLGKLLLQNPSILLLDEPTNHLDMDSIAYLEEFLREYRGAAIIVSHDRYFLDAVCTRIGEIAHHELTLYDGNYSSFLVQREERRKEQEKAYALNQKEIRRHEEIIATYRRFNREKSIKKARSWEKKLAKLERVDPPAQEASLRLRFDEAQKSGNDVLIVRNLSMGFGEKQLFTQLSFALQREDRLAIVGKNGIGKTTLLRILTEQIAAQSGDYLWGTGVRLGYFDQQQSGLCLEKTVLQELQDAFPALDTQVLRSRLGAFLFRGDEVYQRIGSLSGGERSRVALLKLLLGQANVLVLDEPTNHLDADSCRALEAALCEYHGTVLFVSHDRYFINTIATRVLEIAEEGCTQYLGDWDDYLAQKAANRRAEELGVEPTANKTEQRKQLRAKNARSAQHRAAEARVREAEAMVAETEQHKAQVEEQLNNSGLSPQDALALSQEYERLSALLEERLSQWEAAMLALEEQKAEN